MHREDKYSQHSSIIWPVWLNGQVFVYELSGCGFEFSCRRFLKPFWTCERNDNNYKNDNDNIKK